MNFDTVADELYCLPPEDFTATRTAREKEAKTAGDTDLAGRIRKLTKPNAVGWLANQLVREHPEDIQPLIELGDDLRAALAGRSGDRLRELSTLQRQLISALVEEAKHLGRGAGRPVSADTARELTNTLRAALSDSAAAKELLAGRLVVGLYRSGLENDSAESEPVPEPVPASASESAPARQSSAPKTVRRKVSADPRAAEERSAAEQAEQRLIAESRIARDQAQLVADDAEQAASDARKERERAQSALDAAKAAQSEANRSLRQARAALAKVDRTLQKAVTS
ncbi:MAG: hypothetical protein ACR2P2_00630 [Nakamurella sp.]